MKKSAAQVAIIFLGCLIAFSGTAFSAPINEVSYASLTGTELIDFEDVAAGNYDGIFESGNTAFAQHFVGQTVSSSGDFDVITGSPSGGLTLVTGAQGQNIEILNYGLPWINVLAGLGPLGYPNLNATGEGAFSLLFDNDQSQFGFELMGGNAGDAFIDFFARDGSLIDSVILGNITSGFYGFMRDGGIKDIAGISLWNNDLGGIGFDNLKYDVAGNPEVVPEPSTFILLGSGLAGLALVARRRKKV